MNRFFVSATGALYYDKRTEFTSISNIPKNSPALTEISEQDYAERLAAQKVASKERFKEAVRTYQESEREVARTAYEELRALGMSEKVARAFTKYYE